MNFSPAGVGVLYRTMYSVVQGLRCEEEGELPVPLLALLVF